MMYREYRQSSITRHDKIELRCQAKQNAPQHDPPPFAGNDAEALIFTLRKQLPCLPPLVITGVCDMQNISILEDETSSWEAAVFGRVVVKERPVGNNWKG